MEFEERYALYFDGEVLGDSLELLKENATKVSIGNYERAMDGKLFCPICYKKVTRSPKNKSKFADGRKAYFAHLSRKSLDEDCKWRSKISQKNNIQNGGGRALASNKDVVVHRFQKEKPAGSKSQNSISSHEVMGGDEASEGRGFTALKDKDCSASDEISTVQAICSGFDENLERYYTFPGPSKKRVLLRDALIDVESVSGVDDEPKLYYGVFDGLIYLRGAPFIRLRFKSVYNPVLCMEYRDFCIKCCKDSPVMDKVTEDLQGRTVLVWGAVCENGMGLCIQNPGWGEFAVLPKIYSDLI